MLFATRMQGNGCLPDNKLITEPFNHWKKALDKFITHEQTLYHQQANMELQRAFSRPSFQEEQDEARRRLREIVATNRKDMKAIITILIFLCKQGLPLRGHRGETISDLVSSSARGNPGNFLALLKLVAEFQPSLWDRFTRAAAARQENRQISTYHSPAIQNEIIQILADKIRSAIVSEVRAAKFFAIMADESADVSNTEQMSLAVRYVNAKNIICESLLDFSALKDLSGRGISGAILELLSKHGLDMRDCRGQAYDGAGAMAGKENGAAALITDQFPSAVYFHCAAHRLSLCISSSCLAASDSSLILVRNALAFIDEIAKFFNNSPKRNNFFQDNKSDGGRSGQVRPFCRTRWMHRIDTLEAFFDDYSTLISTLRAIALSKSSEPPHWNPDAVKDAAGLLNGLSSFQTIFPLFVLQKVLADLRMPTSLLQLRSLDIQLAYNVITKVKERLKTQLSDIDSVHAEWYKDAAALFKEVTDVEPDMPRVSRKNIYGFSNTDLTDKPELFYRVQVTMPFLQHLLSELETRFPPLSAQIADGLTIVPSGLKTLSNPDGPATAKRVWLQRILQAAKAYETDINTSSLERELHTWYSVWLEYIATEPPNDSIPNCLAATLTFFSEFPNLGLAATSMSPAASYSWKTFPTIHTYIRILATLPITSVENERAFSAMGRILTAIRSSCSDTRFANLCLIHYHYDFAFNVRDIVKTFASASTVRMSQLLYPASVSQ
jgi:hypothetical protein